MEQYYITAELSRAAEAREEAEIGVHGAQVYLCRVKTIVNADTWQEAMTEGKAKIKRLLRPNIVATCWGCMSVRAAEEIGDIEIYERYITAGTLPFFRAVVGMSQIELAERSGVNVRQIRRVESGDSAAGNLTARNLLAIADALGVDPRDLV